MTASPSRFRNHHLNRIFPLPMANFVHKPIYRLGNALAESMRDANQAPQTLQTNIPDVLKDLANDTSFLDEAGPRPNETLFEPEQTVMMTPPPLPSAASMPLPAPPIQVANPQAPVSYDPSAYPDAVNYGSGDPQDSSERDPQGTASPAVYPNPRTATVSYGMPNHINYLSEREEVQERIDPNWLTKGNHKTAGLIGILTTLAILAIIGYAYVFPSFLSLGLAIAGSGIIAYFGTLSAANRLSNSSNLDRGEYRKAITTSFVVVYFILLAANAVTGLDGVKLNLGNIIDNFTYLVGMIIGFYFTSSMVRDWKQGSSNDYDFTGEYSDGGGD